MWRRGRAMTTIMLAVAVGWAPCMEGAKKKGVREACEAAKSAERLVEAAQELLAGGGLDQAVRCLKRGSTRFADSGAVWGEYGEALEELGDESEAAKAFAKALSLDPSLALPTLKLGNIRAAQGRDHEAIELFLVAARLRPESPIPHNNIGLAHMRLGDNEAALAAFEGGLESTPEGAYGRTMILNNLGLLLNQMDPPRTEHAVEVLQEALSLELSLETYTNLAGALNGIGDYEQAAEVMQQGIVSEGGKVSLLSVTILATALAMQDRLEEANSLLSQLPEDQRALALADVSRNMQVKGRGYEAAALLSGGELGVQEFVRLGSTLAGVHEGRDAVRAYATALRLDPRDVAALSGAASLFYSNTLYRDAEKLFKRVLVALHATEDAITEAYNGLGATIEMQHTRLDEAVDNYREAHVRNPNFIHPFFSLVHLLGRVCNWEGWDDNFVKMRSLIDAGVVSGIGPIFALAYDLTDEQMCKVAQHRAADIEGHLASLRPHFTAAAPQWTKIPEKMTIAVISADFNGRPVGQLVQGMFQLIDKTRFDVFAFSSSINDQSQVLLNIFNSVEEFFWVKGMHALGIGELVNSVQAHVLIDLNGYTDGGRLEVAALRPAPVAVNYLGYPYTVALRGIDYVLADRVVAPPEQMGCFTERAVFLPEMYMVSDHRQSQAHQINGTFTAEDAAARGLPHRVERVVLANFNHLQKLGPATFGLWMRVMAAVGGTVLWLLKFPKEAEAHIMAAARSHDVAEDRLLFTPKFADVEHLRVKRGASMLLDTLEYNAHVSGLDALWSGLPLVSMAGSNMARRCGASFLRTQGLEELLARDTDDYVLIASALARSPALLERVRGRVERARGEGPLFDTSAWVLDLERALQAMWEVAAAAGARGEVPQPAHIALAGYRGWGGGRA